MYHETNYLKLMFGINGIQFTTFLDYSRIKYSTCFARLLIPYLIIDHKFVFLETIIRNIKITKIILNTI